MTIGIGVGAGCAIHGKVTEGPRASSSAASSTPTGPLAAGPPPTGVNYMRSDMRPDPCAPPCTGDCTEPTTTAVMSESPRIDPGGRCLETLASHQNTARPILLVGADLIWGNWDSIARVSTHGGTPIAIASNQKRPIGLAVDANNLYWTNIGRAGSGSFKKTDPDFSATVVAAPLAGGPPTVLASDQKDPEAIAVDGTNVYWTNLAAVDSAGSVLKVPLRGGKPTTLASKQTSPGGIAVAGGFVFWTADAMLKRIPVGGGTPVVISSADELVGGDIAIAGGNVYYFSSPNSQSKSSPDMARAGTDDTRLCRMPLNGGPPVVLTTHLSSPHSIVIDGATVYLVDSGVLKVPIAGGTAEPIGGEKELIFGIAVDATSVYWTDDRGNVKKLTPK